MTTIFLDSNIYRQFGHDFPRNLDYKRLRDFLSKTFNEFGILKVVKEEITDHITKDIFDRLKTDYHKTKTSIEKNPFIDIQTIESLDAKIDEGKDVALKQLDFHETGSMFYPANTLIDFLLYNKRINGKKDNTRDFLIYFDLLLHSQENVETQIVFISEDDIFYSNEFFFNLKKEMKVENLHVFKSIPDFLKEFGPQFDFVTDDFILASLDKNIVHDELMKDIKCFPSYISKYYYDKGYDGVPEVEKLTINDISVYDFYVTKDLNAETYSIQYSLKVSINVLYHPEKNIDELKQFLFGGTNILNPDIFDAKFRPIFNHSVLFLFEGKVNPDKKKISPNSFIDFFPDHFIEKERREEYKKEDASELLCADGQPHTMDKNGFYKPSIFGGGLSWHYRCTKCGKLQDTGEYFD